MTVPFDESSRPKVSPHVYARAFGAEVVLLDFGKGEYFGLDAVAADIWHRLEAGDDLGAVATCISKDYEVSRDAALRDIIELVIELQNHELLDRG